MTKTKTNETVDLNDTHKGRGFGLIDRMRTGIKNSLEKLKKYGLESLSSARNVIGDVFNHYEHLFGGFSQKREDWSSVSDKKVENLIDKSGESEGLAEGILQKRIIDATNEKELRIELLKIFEKIDLSKGDFVVKDGTMRSALIKSISLSKINEFKKYMIDELVEEYNMTPTKAAEFIEWRMGNDDNKRHNDVINQVVIGELTPSPEFYLVLRSDKKIVLRSYNFLDALDDYLSESLNTDITELDNDFFQTIESGSKDGVKTNEDTSTKQELTQEGEKKTVERVSLSVGDIIDNEIAIGLEKISKGWINSDDYNVVAGMNAEQVFRQMKRIISYYGINKKTKEFSEIIKKLKSVDSNFLRGETFGEYIHKKMFNLFLVRENIIKLTCTIIQGEGGKCRREDVYQRKAVEVFSLLRKNKNKINNTYLTQSIAFLFYRGFIPQKDETLKDFFYRIDLSQNVNGDLGKEVSLKEVLTLLEFFVPKLHKAVLSSWAQSENDKTGNNRKKSGKREIGSREVTLDNKGKIPYWETTASLRNN